MYLEHDSSKSLDRNGRERRESKEREAKRVRKGGDKFDVCMRENWIMYFMKNTKLSNKLTLLYIYS